MLVYNKLMHYHPLLVGVFFWGKQLDGARTEKTMPQEIIIKLNPQEYYEN